MVSSHKKKVPVNKVAYTPTLKKQIDEMAYLCRQYTNLSEGDISRLIGYAKNLTKQELYKEEDVFIDIKDIHSEDAIVVFHKPPMRKKSMYHQNVIGHRAHKNNEPGVIRTLETGLETNGLSAMSQEGFSVQQKIFPIKVSERVIGVVVIEKDVTREIISSFYDRRNELTDTLQQVDVQNIALTEFVDDAVLIFDEQGKLKHHNKAAEKYYHEQFGYLDDITNMHYDNLSLDFYKFKTIKKMAQEKTWDEHRFVEVKYGYHYFSIKRHFVTDNKMLVMICKDITDIKQKETRLIAESVAIQEIHHRVKNNLQTIVSLLRLQSRRSQNKEVEKALNDSIGRILSIASTHNLLSKKTEDEVVLFEVLKNTIENIQRFFADKIDVKLDCYVDKEIVLDSNRTVAIALIVNELLQNSFDHAFEDYNVKVPSVKLSVMNEDGIIRLLISDNGKGYQLETPSTKTLGLKIVTEFVKSKLSGKLFIKSSSKGTTTTVSFKYKSN